MKKSIFVFVFVVLLLVGCTNDNNSSKCVTSIKETTSNGQCATTDYDNIVDSDVSAVPGPYGGDLYDKKYEKVWKSDDERFTFTCNNKKQLGGRGGYKATYKGKENLIEVYNEGYKMPGYLTIDAIDGYVLFGGDYTYNSDDKKSIIVVVDYMNNKLMAKVGLDGIKKGDKIIFRQQ